MSASQVRYCMLQARKNDIEYQGQQINQQRTTLATQSAAHNTELLTLTVPTPPSSEQYTKTTYTYQMNGNTCTIKGINVNSDGSYKITYSTTEIKDTATRGAKFTYQQTTADTVTPASDKLIFNSTAYTMTAVNASDAEHSANITAIRDLNKVSGADLETYYYITLENGTNKYAYFTESELKAAKNNANLVQDYVVSPQQTEKAGQVLNNATINWSETGRMVSITSNGQTYTLDVETSADNQAYENAYNEYLYAKDQYNKKMDDINAKLSVIQSQDKQLELQLRNLDTQEKAITTEMDAVKSVTDKNIEKSFNVFG